MKKAKRKSKKPTIYGEVMVVTSVRLPSHIMKEVKARYGKLRIALERLLVIDDGRLTVKKGQWTLTDKVTKKKLS